VSKLNLEDERIADLFHGAERAWAAVRERVRAAEAELEQFVETAIGLQRDVFQRGLDRRQHEVEQAKRALYELDDPGLDEDIPVVDFGNGPVLLQGRGDDPERDRQRMRRVISKITLRKTDPALRRWEPIENRLTIRWMGESE
jgi:hypothetical protein